MGILTDVFAPIEELIRPTEGLGQQLLAERLEPVLYEARALLVDLQLKALFTSFTRFR